MLAGVAVKPLEDRSGSGARPFKLCIPGDCDRGSLAVIASFKGFSDFDVTFCPRNLDHRHEECPFADVLWRWVVCILW